MNELTSLTAAQAADAVKTGQVRSIDLVEALLERIDQLNPELNAIVTLDADGARSQARAADEAVRAGGPLGALHGVPVTIKDSFETAGLRTTSGFPPFAKRVPAADAAPVAGLRKAGAIILGKTNLPPLASGIQSNNPLFGRTNNPWDHKRTPGGSSGGAAAAIAARLSYLELGSDIGGSIRIPAHFCGVYGLKCTGGRVTGRGHLASPGPLTIPDGWGPLFQLASMGPLARSIADLRLALAAIAEPGTPALEAPVKRDLADLRVAWTDDFGGTPLDIRSARLLRALAENLARTGCRVERVTDPGFDFTEAWFTAGACLGAVNTLFQPPFMRGARRLVGPLLERSARGKPLMRGIYAGMSLRADGIRDLLARRERVIAQVETFLSHWDAWLCPVFPTPAFTHRPPNAAIDVDGTPLSMLEANLLHSILFNLTGHPVATIPIGRTSAGLPVGVQVVGRRWQESALLDAAEAIAGVTEGFVAPEVG